MGNSIAKAEALAESERKKVQNLINILENKRKEFLERIKLTRGEGGEGVSREIQGGRTACRISEIRVADSKGADPGITEAIGDFITAAQGGDQAKNAAVNGATALLKSGLDALFGASSGGGLEKEGFVVLFLNFSFVRIDYLVYSYNVSGSKWGAVANESGSCYVTDIAILNPGQDVKPYEIDYLLGQALSIKEDAEDGDAEFEAIAKMKIRLVQSAILSRKLANEDLTFSQLSEITTSLTEVNKSIQDAFSTLSDFDGGKFIPPPKPIIPDDILDDKEDDKEDNNSAPGTNTGTSTN